MRLVSKMYHYNGLFFQVVPSLCFKANNIFVVFFLFSGNRYITITGCWWFEEVAKVLDEEFRPLGKAIQPWEKEKPLFLNFPWFKSKLSLLLCQTLDLFFLPWFSNLPNFHCMYFNLFFRSSHHLQSKIHSLHRLKWTKTIGLFLLFGSS